MNHLLLFLAAFTLATATTHSAPPSPAAHPIGRIVTQPLTSTILRDNRVGLDPQRSIKVYLPPGYEGSAKSYPVVYFCHGMGWGVDRVFADGNFQALMETAFAKAVVPEFILVVPDYGTPSMGCLYENSTTTGRWIDYTIQEVVPLIDRTFRTLARPESRALTGDFMGGRGALALAVLHPEVFGVTYAMHPVATGVGQVPWSSNLEADWTRVHAAKTFEELPTAGRTRIFTLISQGFLPNPNRPPFHADFPFELGDGVARPHPENIRRLTESFLLDAIVRANPERARRLRAIGLDWARYDTTVAHVYSNQDFSRLLDDLGVVYEAEEYAGTPWNKNWIPNGRFAARVLPFFAQHLVFDQR